MTKKEEKVRHEQESEVHKIAILKDEVHISLRN